jgi:hypothetical protein
MPVIRIMQELLSRRRDAEKNFIVNSAEGAVNLIKNSASLRLCGECLFLLKNSQIDCP